MRAPKLRDAFLSLKDHAWFKRVYKRLSEDDLRFCNTFIEFHGDLDVDEFESTVNRMFLDNPNKPHRWQEIQELLANANSITKEKI